MTETYSYAADRKRRQRVTVSGTTNYLWDQENVLAELDQNRVTQAQYTQFPGEWGGLVSQRRSRTSSFYGFDLAGNTRALLSPAAGVTDRYRYKAFGDELPPSGTTTNPHRYCGVLGYQRDSATRLYVRARHLGVTAGRWMNRDPMGFRGGDSNLYRYVSNRPFAGGDPSGLLALASSLIAMLATANPCGISVPVLPAGTVKRCEDYVDQISKLLKFLPKSLREKLKVNKEWCLTLCNTADWDYCVPKFIDAICGKLKTLVSAAPASWIVKQEINVVCKNAKALAAALIRSVNEHGRLSNPMTRYDCWVAHGVFGGSDFGHCAQCCGHITNDADEEIACDEGCQHSPG